MSLSRSVDTSDISVKFFGFLKNWNKDRERERERERAEGLILPKTQKLTSSVTFPIDNSPKISFSYNDASLDLVTYRVGNT